MKRGESSPAYRPYATLNWWYPKEAARYKSSLQFSADYIGSYQLDKPWPYADACNNYSLWKNAEREIDARYFRPRGKKLTDYDNLAVIYIYQENVPPKFTGPYVGCSLILIPHPQLNDKISEYDYQTGSPQFSVLIHEINHQFGMKDKYDVDYAYRGTLFENPIIKVRDVLRKNFDSRCARSKKQNDKYTQEFEEGWSKLDGAEPLICYDDAVEMGWSKKPSLHRLAIRIGCYLKFRTPFIIGRKKISERAFMFDKIQH